MNWEDECFLLSKRKFRENANIIIIFTETKGKMLTLLIFLLKQKVK